MNDVISLFWNKSKSKLKQLETVVCVNHESKISGFQTVRKAKDKYPNNYLINPCAALQIFISSISLYHPIFLSVNSSIPH